MKKTNINVLGFNCSNESIEEVVEKLNYFKTGYVAYCFMHGEMVYRKRRPATISRDIGLNLLVVNTALPEGKSEWSFEDVVYQFATCIWLRVYSTMRSNIYYLRKFEMFMNFEDKLVSKFDVCLEFEYSERHEINHVKVCACDGTLLVNDPYMGSIREYPYTWLWLRTALYDMMNSMGQLEIREPYMLSPKLFDREKFDAVKAKLQALIDLLAVNNMDLITLILKDGV